MEQTINIEELIQDDHNFNKGTEAGQKLMERSFKELGAGRSILVDKDGRIIAGNKSQKAAMAAGIRKVRVIETQGDELIAVKRTDLSLDSKEGRELAYADNLTTQVNLLPLSLNNGALIEKCKRVKEWFKNCDAETKEELNELTMESFCSGSFEFGIITAMLYVEKLLNKANLTCKMREGWTCAVDNKALEMDDLLLYAEHCTIASFDIPDMVAKMQENGYDVTEDMLTRFIELWLKQEGKTYLMERGVTLSTPCSCCNPFLLSVYHNGDLELKDLYAV